MSMKLGIFSGIVLVAVMMASCCQCRKSSSFYDQFDKLVGTEWKLIQKDDKAFNVGGDNYTIAFGEDKRIFGMGDCNRYSGVMDYSVTRNVQSLSIGQLASTRMGCMDMAGENQFFEFLRNASSINVDDDLMVITSKNAAQEKQRWVFEKIKK